MNLRAAQNANARRAGETVGVEVPAGLVEQWRRAIASAVKFAIWQPVTNANDASGGSRSSSLTHAPATSSTTDADGPATYSPAF